MIGRAMIVSDGVSHRVLFLQSKVVTDDSGADVIRKDITHREIPAPTKDAAVKAAKSVGTDLSREPYSETGAAPKAGSLSVVGVFGAPAALPKAK